MHNSVIQSPAAVSSLSRSSPLVSSMHHSAGGPFSLAHRPPSPSGAHATNLSRTSPLHLQQGPHPSSMAERDRQMLRQQSPHMTPPPTSASSQMISSPLGKMYAPGQRPNSPPPHHFRPGASPPVVRHPQMPLPLPMMGPGAGMPSQVMHPSQNPYQHHPLIHPSMFYGHNPFNSPYSYPPYAPPGFAYMKPPSGNPMDNPMLSHHPTSIPPPRSDEPPSPHANGPKSITQMQVGVSIKPNTKYFLVLGIFEIIDFS